MLGKKFKYRNTMILYLITAGFKMNLSNNEEKERMKHIVIGNNHKAIIGKLLENYEKNGNVEEFIGKFKEVVYKDREHFMESSYNSTSGDSDDNISSPQDTLLKKIKKESTRKYEEGLKKSEENVHMHDNNHNEQSNGHGFNNQQQWLNSNDLSVIQMKNVGSSP